MSLFFATQSGAPPGPRGLPLLGSAREFSRDPLDFLRTTGERFGDISLFRLGRTRVYFLRHPDHIREVLISRRASFTISPLREKIIPVVGNGLLTSRGEFHARQRRLIQPVFRKSRIEAYASAMGELSGGLRAAWAPGMSVDIGAEMMKLTMLIAARALFAHDIGAEAQRMSHSIDTALEFFTRLGSPLLRLELALPLPSTLRLRAAIAELDRVIYGMIARRRASGAAGEDLLSLLMRATDDDTHAGMDDKQLRDEILTLLLAGHETNANVLAWTLYLLAQDPESERRVHEEAHSLLAGRRAFGTGDADRLPFTRHVMQEGLRLYPPGWFVGRLALEDVPVGGHAIPRGAMVLMSQYVTHRDARFYEDPDRFKPGRWEDGLEERLPRCAYFPFSAGDRHCMGEGFAWQEALLILATLIAHWRLELVSGQTIRPRPSVTLRPDGPIKMIVRPR